MYFKIFSVNSHPNLVNRINNLRTISKHVFESHYDVLNVKRDCSSKEIKDAFINLSKQYHPDTTNNVASHKRFIKVVEAYNVLSKPHSRRNYDLSLIHQGNVRSDKSYTYYYEQHRPPRDSSFWEYRDKSQDKYYEDKPYYGIKGIKRVSNNVIVLLCLLVAAIGIGLQVLAIRRSVTFKRNLMIKKSMAAEEMLTGIRRDAMKYGNEIQLQRLKARMVASNLIPEENVDSKNEE